MSRARQNKKEIINYYEVIPKKFKEDVKNPYFNSHHIEIPFRMCVVAPSGSGKTNFIVNLIKVFSQGQGTFTDITIITRNKDEPLYNWLETLSDRIKIFEGMRHNPKLDDYDKEYNHLLIWDDLVLSKNLNEVSEYYIRARKKNVSLCFLSQSYADIPKIIRKNSSYLVLFDLGGSKRERTYIMNEWGSDLEKEELIAIYNDATAEHMRPLIIKGGKTKRNEKYRKGFSDFYNLDDFFRENPVSVEPVKRGRKIKINDNYERENSSSDSDN
jgi:hypothetical protein